MGKIGLVGCSSMFEGTASFGVGCVQLRVGVDRGNVEGWLTIIEHAVDVDLKM